MVKFNRIHTIFLFLNDHVIKRIAKKNIRISQFYTGGKLFKCQMCGKQFSITGRFNSHHESSHWRQANKMSE